MYLRSAKLLAAVAMLSITALAQTNTSTMDGLISDAQGAVVPRASVSVRNTETGQTFNTLSDDKGHWAVPSLPTALIA